jgi:hypothetical protein
VFDGIAVAVPERTSLLNAVKVGVIPGGSPVTVAPVAPPDNWYSIGSIAKGTAGLPPTQID